MQRSTKFIIAGAVALVAVALVAAALVAAAVKYKATLDEMEAESKRTGDIANKAAKGLEKVQGTPKNKEEEKALEDLKKLPGYTSGDNEE